jgi:hypothetical protein
MNPKAVILWVGLLATFVGAYNLYKAVQAYVTEPKVSLTEFAGQSKKSGGYYLLTDLDLSADQGVSNSGQFYYVSLIPGGGHVFLKVSDKQVDEFKKSQSIHEFRVRLIDAPRFSASDWQKLADRFGGDRPERGLSLI